MIMQIGIKLEPLMFCTVLQGQQLRGISDVLLTNFIIKIKF